jgi:IS30 family transposase
MKSHYRHLNAEERGVIFAENQRGSSLRGIGLLLARHHGTIGHELKRGVVPAGYDPQVARRTYYTAQRRSGRPRKLVPDAPFYDSVRDRLIHLRWSPEQIAARLRLMRHCQVVEFA